MQILIGQEHLPNGLQSDLNAKSETRLLRLQLPQAGCTSQGPLEGLMI